MSYIAKLKARTLLSLTKPSGVEQEMCCYCKSNLILTKRKKIILPPFEIPDCIRKYSDQLIRRDNGICKNCNLEQSFYTFSEEARLLFFEMGLETLSSGDGFSLYPPPEHIIQSTYEDHFKLRIQRWEKYFQLKNISTVNDVLFFRPYYGKVLKELKGLFRCNISSKDVIHNCEKYIKNNFSFVRTLEGDIFGKVNLVDVANESFDFIVCFHTLTHSVQLHEDLQILKGLLKKDGFVIFCDEIMKKPNNPFHMVHFDEAVFKKILLEQFGSVERIDDCGSRNRFICENTFKKDNPDIVAFK